MATGARIASARDLARFGMLYLQGGVWNGGGRTRRRAAELATAA